MPVSVIRFTGQIIGLSPQNDQYNGALVTIVDAGSMILQPITFYTGSQAVISALAIGQNVFLDLTLTGTDQTAIAGVATVIPDGTNQ